MNDEERIYITTLGDAFLARAELMRACLDRDKQRVTTETIVNVYEFKRAHAQVLILKTPLLFQGHPVKHYCMDCAHYRRKLSVEDRMFLVRMLAQYNAALMLRSWMKLGQVKKPGGHGADSDKVKAVEILKRGGSFCKKEHVHIYALDVGYVFYEPAEEERVC